MRAALTFLVLLVGCGHVVDDKADAGGADADPCATGTCECTVATEDTDCGTHKYCNVSATGRTCDCVAGYTSGVSGCVWTGTLQDPGFSAASTWMVSKGALLNSTAVGSVDPGEAAFLPSAICALGDVHQTVDMPSFRKSEPLVLDLSYKNQVTGQFGGERVLMGVSFGGRGWSPLTYFNDALYHQVRVCMPEGGYAPALTTGKGAQTTFAFGPYTKSLACPNSMISNFAVDHAAIVPANAGECGTAPGQGPNFDAEGTGGFTFTTSGNSSGGFVAGIGQAGTRAARINLSARCESAAMTTAITVPNVQNPALDMYVGASPGSYARMTFGVEVIRSFIAPTGTAVPLHMCLPPSLRGQTMPINFSVSSITGGLCTDIVNLQAWVDNIKAVDDPACASTASFSNPGFEQGSIPLGAFGSSGSSTASVAIRSGAATAHTGTKALSIDSQGRCSSSGFTMLPTVPAASGTSGPALKFFASVGVNPDASTTARAVGGTTVTLTEGGGYMPYVVCLDPQSTGRVQVVSINHDGGSGLCDNSNYVQQSALIDDIDVTTDPSCPAQ